MTPMRGVGPIPFMLEAPASFPVVAGLVPANPNCHYAVLGIRIAATGPAPTPVLH